MDGYEPTVALHTSRDVCRLAGVTYRQLDYWVRGGLLLPPVPATGSGSQRLFDTREAQIAWVLGQCSRLGQGLPELDVLRGLPEWGGYVVAFDGGVVHAPTMDDVLQYGPAFILVDLDWAPFGAVEHAELQEASR